MKGRIPHVCLLFLGLLLSKSAVTQVPEAVLRTFATTFPDAGEVQWSDQLRYHEAHFRQADEQTIAVFDPIGTCIATGHVIPVDSLPGNIAQQFEESYYQTQPTQVARIHYLNGGVLYRCTFHEGAMSIVVERDGKGRPVGPEDEGQE